VAGALELEAWARSLETGVSAALELEAWVRSLGTGVSAALEREAWARSLGTGVKAALEREVGVVFVLSGGNGKENRCLGNSLRKCGVKGWSTLRVLPARRAARTQAPNSLKRATLLAFGEIGSEEGLGEVASAAVIG
jgi:hypothetical protein